MSAMRCAWCGTDPVYIRYHDHEWGVPIRDPRALWESLMLESFQAGLSWITILRRRDAFRAAFAGFDPQTLETWGESDILRLLGDPGIIRHRGKIANVITAAQAYQGMKGGFADFIWAHVAHRPLQPHRVSAADVPTFIPQAEALSKSLKSAGFKYCGPTICYAFMQAVGMINDHLITCPAHDAVGD